MVRNMMAALLLILATGAAQAEQINLNLANAETLQSIPGIGPAKAGEIIRLRDQQGGFKSMEDLLAVPGIGEKTLIEIRKHGALDSGASTVSDEAGSGESGGDVSTTAAGAAETSS
jgi:competence protein ComEA